MTIEAVRGATVPAPKEGSYIARHWRGQLPLSQSYWINGVLIGLPFNLYFRVVTLLFKAQPIETAVAAFEWIVLPFLLWQPVLVWQGVGIWRSAGQRIREGKKGWSWVARVVVLTNLVVLLYGAFVYAKLVWTLSFMYFDQQSAHYQMSVVANRVVFSGEITPASADALEPVLKRKDIERLVIRQSVGGYVLPSMRLAKVIRDRNLVVVATVECASICTALLASGAERFVLPTTVIRLHTTTQIGTGDVIRSQEDEVEALYRGAGMTESLLAKLRAHRGPYDLYEPTMREVIENGLVTHVFDAPSNGYVPAQEWCTENADACGRTGRQNAGRAARH